MTRRIDEQNALTALRYIRDTVNQRGYPPSQREIAAACGWKSASDANALLRLMEAHGLVRIAPGIPRGLTITEAGMNALTVDV